MSSITTTTTSILAGNPTEKDYYLPGGLVYVITFDTAAGGLGKFMLVMLPARKMEGAIRLCFEHF